jgi:hypothetical protein
MLLNTTAHSFSGVSEATLAAEAFLIVFLGGEHYFCKLIDFNIIQ